MTSGISQSYSLPVVTSPTMFAGSSAYQIAVDKRHSSLRLSLRDNAPDANVVLYVRRGKQPEVINGSVVADYALPATGNQDLVLEGASYGRASTSSRWASTALGSRRLEP